MLTPGVAPPRPSRIVSGMTGALTRPGPSPVTKKVCAASRLVLPIVLPGWVWSGFWARSSSCPELTVMSTVENVLQLLKTGPAPGKLNAGRIRKVEKS